MYVIIIIIIMAGMAVFYMAGYLIEERRRWPVIIYTISEMYASYLVFSHSPTLLHANSCKINCSMDVKIISLPQHCHGS